MKKIKTIGIVTIFIIALSFVTASAQTGDTPDVQTENRKFVELARKLQDELKNIFSERITSGEYCNEKGCWSSVNGGQVLEFKGANGDTWNIDNFGQVVEYVKGNQNWKNANSGQFMTYNDGDIEWSSDNFGQVLQYRYNGWLFKSSNFGQVLEFIGPDGQVIESINFGQSINKDGENLRTNPDVQLEDYENYIDDYNEYDVYYDL